MSCKPTILERATALTDINTTKPEGTLVFEQVLSEQASNLVTEGSDNAAFLKGATAMLAATSMKFPAVITRVQELSHAAVASEENINSQSNTIVNAVQSAVQQGAIVKRVSRPLSVVHIPAGKKIAILKHGEVCQGHSCMLYLAFFCSSFKRYCILVPSLYNCSRTFARRSRSKSHLYA